MHLLSVVIEYAFVFGFLVLVHELGHFIMAKLCGVRVEVFSIGFPPKLFGFRYGETEYRISILPLGGYVKMAGESVLTDAGLSGTGSDNLTAKPRWQRVLIAVAGPASNFLLAFFLLFLVAHYHQEVDHYLIGPAVLDYVPQGTAAAHDSLAAGDTINRFNGTANPDWEQIIYQSALNLNRPVPIVFTHNGEVHTSTLTISVPSDNEFEAGDVMKAGLIPRMNPGPIQVFSVTADSPASRAGLRPGDQLLTINDLSLHSIAALTAYLNDNKGAIDTLDILRNGRPMTLVATPEKIDTNGVGDEYRLGFSNRPPPPDIERLPFGKALYEALKHTREGSMLILLLIKGLITRHVAVNQLMGPVGIAQQIDIATQLGIWQLLNLVSVISLNLGILNLIPFPLLDGGMIFFLIIESIMRRDVKERFKEVVYQVAFVFIVLFTFYILFNDITKLHLH